MKFSECNARQKKAWKNIKWAASDYIFGMMNGCLDNPKEKEAPADIYKQSPDDLTEEEKNDVHRSLRLNHVFEQNNWHDHELIEAIKLAWEDGNYYKVYTEQVSAMLEDVDAFVESFNFRDCDGQIDYFNVHFHYFDCKPKDLKIVPKTARIKNKPETTAAAAT